MTLRKMPGKDPFKTNTKKEMDRQKEKEHTHSEQLRYTNADNIYK